MSSASIYVFCVPQELTTWVGLLCHKKMLGMVLFRNGFDFGEVAYPTDDGVAIPEDTYRVFLFPKEQSPKSRLRMNDVNARGAGWVDIRPGRFVTQRDFRTLLLSEFHGEDSQDNEVMASKSVVWLKRRIAGQSKAGVVGKNLSTGGSSSYRDIRFSAAALDAHRSGVAWKQFEDGVVVFEPAPPKGKETGARSDDSDDLETGTEE